MKILLLIHSLNVGGAELIVAEYALRMKELGHEVVIVEHEIKDSYIEKKIEKSGIKKYVLFPNFKLSLMGRAKRFLSKIWLKKKWKDIIREENPDIVHIHTVSNNYRAVFPLQKTVYTFHANVKRTIDLCGKKNYQNICRFAQNGLNFIAINKQMLSDIKYYFDSENAIYIPNGINVEKIAGSKYDRTEFLASLGIPKDAFIVGHVGRFDPVKNHEKLISVFEKVVQKKGNAYLLLVGGGQDDRVSAIKKIVEEKGLMPKVHFLGVRADAYSIESCFDVFVLPSRSESFSLTFLEAQLHGVKCVISDVLPREVICTPNCFFVSLESSDDDWADCVIGTSGVPAEIVSSTDDFDIKHVVDRTLRYYSEILEGNKK